MDSKKLLRLKKKKKKTIDKMDNRGAFLSDNVEQGEYVRPLLWKGVEIHVD